MSASDIDGFTCGYFPVADMSNNSASSPNGRTTQLSAAAPGFSNSERSGRYPRGYRNTVLIVYGESGKSTGA